MSPVSTNQPFVPLPQFAPEPTLTAATIPKQPAAPCPSQSPEYHWPPSTSTSAAPHIAPATALALKPMARALANEPIKKGKALVTALFPAPGCPAVARTSIQQAHTELPDSRICNCRHSYHPSITRRGKALGQHRIGTRSTHHSCSRKGYMPSHVRLLNTSGHTICTVTPRPMALSLSTESPEYARSPDLPWFCTYICPAYIPPCQDSC